MSYCTLWVIVERMAVESIAQQVWDVCSQSSRKTSSKKYRYNDRCSDLICGLRFCDGVQVIKVVGRRIDSSAHIHTRYVIRSLRDISKSRAGSSCLPPSMPNAIATIQNSERSPTPS
jgi:hypothetical protein